MPARAHVVACLRPRFLPSRALACALVMAAATAWASDVQVEGGGALTSTSADNPRSGNGWVSAALEWTPSDAWLLLVTAQYTRDLGTSTAEATSPGSNLFLFGAGAEWTPDSHWLASLHLTGAPPTTQTNATTVSYGTGRTADLVLESHDWSLGGTLEASWASAGSSSFESTVDLAISPTFFSLLQQAEVPSTQRGVALRTFCDTTAGQRTQACQVVSGVSATLLQTVLAGSYAASLGHTTVALDLAYFLYDRDPASVGTFSVLALSHATVGAGVPTKPFQVTLKPWVSQQLGPVGVKVGYQLGWLADGAGTNHLFTAKVSWRVSKPLKVWLAAAAQFDLPTSGALENLGASLTLGTQLGW